MYIPVSIHQEKCGIKGAWNIFSYLSPEAQVNLTLADHPQFHCPVLAATMLEGGGTLDRMTDHRRVYEFFPSVWGINCDENKGPSSAPN